jgi:hypothetical protein
MLQTKFAKKRKRSVLCSMIFFSENHALYEIMWENAVQLDRLQMTI